MQQYKYNMIALESSDRGLFQVLSWHLPGETEDNHENLSQNSPSPGRDLNPGPHEYETGLLNTHLQRRQGILVFYVVFLSPPGKCQDWILN
jgi:hypothetical protein